VRYTVIWKPDAEATLTTIWNNAEDRSAVASAANEIDLLLGRQPGAVGESRQDDRRILTVSPLTVYFDVSDDDLKVEVWAVWRSDRKK
jgi:plasmid stabilization system protein ParE